MRYKYKFDGVEYGNPDNWETLITRLKRDEASRGLLFSQDATLQFSNNEYKFFFDKLNIDGFCSETLIEIFEDCNQSGNYKLKFKGIAFTSDCEFDIDKCIVTVKVQDVSFYAKINNNKSLKVSLKGDKSKNGVAITQAYGITINMFYPCDPAAIADRAGIPYLEALRYLVAFMTDDEVAFSCPPLEVGGEFYGLAITTGQALTDVLTTTINPLVSFAEAYENLWKKLNLSFYIDESGLKPTMVMDYTSVIFAQDNLFTLEDVVGLKQSVATTDLYSQIKLGSGTTLDETVGDCTTGAFSESIDFLGCKEESFVILGKCNIDKTLDLTTDWIVSSNVIQDIYINSNDSENDSIVIIDCDVVSTFVYAAKMLNNLGGDPTVTAFYNVRLFNASVAQRFLEAVPQSIANFLSPEVGVVEASRTTTDIIGNVLGTTMTENPVLFANEISDVDSVYTPATGVYEANANLPHVFNINLYVAIVNSVYPDPKATVSIYVDVYDVTITTLLSSTLLASNYYDTVGSKTIEASATVMMNSGENAKIRIEYSIGVFGSHSDLYINPNGTINISRANQGIMQTYNPDDYPVLLYSFTHPLTGVQVDALKANPRGKITFTAHNKTYHAWADDIKINDVSGITDFKLRSSKNKNGSN